jgi:hypothetical protein
MTIGMLEMPETQHRLQLYIGSKSAVFVSGQSSSMCLRPLERMDALLKRCSDLKISL